MNRRASLELLRDLFNKRGRLRMESMQDQLGGVSRSTVKRAIQELREDGYAISYHPGEKDYRYTSSPFEQSYRVGFQLTDKELYALLSLHHLVANLEPASLIRDRVGPIRRKLEQLLAAGKKKTAIMLERVRIIPIASRTIAEGVFQTLGSALLERKQLRCAYYQREEGVSSRRILSPQRLVHYRDNWYLDAWCHQRKALRTFALECISEARISADKATDIDEQRLDAELGEGYGIFAGKATEQAVLRFDAYRSRWVRKEQWHPRQSIKKIKDGGVELTLPYSRPQELVMDILRHGSHVQVIAPDDLRRKVADELVKAASKYQTA